VVVAGIIIVVLDATVDVTVASVIVGVVAGVPPAVVHAPNPRVAATTTTAKRCCITLNHTEHISPRKTPVRQVFPTQRTEIRNPGF
jgi:hypothetical protein